SSDLFLGIINIIAKTIGPISNAFHTSAIFPKTTKITLKTLIQSLDDLQLPWIFFRSEEHTSELQSRFDLVCRLLLEKKKNNNRHPTIITYIINLKLTRKLSIMQWILI